MVLENVVYIGNRMLLGNKTEWNPVISMTTDGNERHIKQSKPGTEQRTVEHIIQYVASEKVSLVGAKCRIVEV
jgi:hypothetical protein